MALTLWYFMLDRDGELTRFPAARWDRLWKGTERLAERAGEELKVVEVVLEVDRRAVCRVVRVVPHRVPVTLDGVLDVETLRRIALERFDFTPAVDRDAARVIRQLELDASSFWELDDRHRVALARALDCRPDDIARASQRPEC